MYTYAIAGARVGSRLADPGNQPDLRFEKQMDSGLWHVVRARSRMLTMLTSADVCWTSADVWIQVCGTLCVRVLLRER